MTRSVELARKFGEVTPAAASRVGTAASQKGSDSDKDEDEDEEYFDSDSDSEEEKEFNPKTMMFRPITEVLKASREALANKGGVLKTKQRIEILEDLQVAVAKLKGIDRVKRISFRQNGTIQYRGGTTSTFELRHKVKTKLTELRGQK